jgi:quercetin dioxygenase-like cupin family protein
MSAVDDRPFDDSASRRGGESQQSGMETAQGLYCATMITRRDAIGSLALFLELAASSARAQAPVPGARPARRPPVFKHALPDVKMDNWEVTVSYVDYAPGQVGKPHHHPGFVLAYVLEGTVVEQVIGEGVSNEVQTYHVGDMFYEPIGATHQVSKNASATDPARLLAMIFAPKGAPLTRPAGE